MLSKLFNAALYIPRLFSCQEYSRRASMNLDRELPLPDKLGLNFHHIYCTFCRRFRKQLELMHQHFDTLSEVDEPSPTEILSDDARKRIREKLRSVEI